jgi:hypothetical protein
MSLSKGHICKHGRHPKIGVTILVAYCIIASARASKQETLKIFCFVICVEDTNTVLIQTQFLITFNHRYKHSTDTNTIFCVQTQTDTNTVFNQIRMDGSEN